MTILVFFLEERSAEEMLKGILPRILPDQVISRFVFFEGKQDLEKQLERKMRLWRIPNSKFVVLRDQDSGDCRKIKQNLLSKCKMAHQPKALIRIACHELESFYVGDLKAVEKGLELKGLSELQNKKKYRNPDRLNNPTQVLLHLTHHRYQKLSGSRAIGMHMDVENNRSHSFNVLIEGIQRLVE